MIEFVQAQVTLNTCNIYVIFLQIIHADTEEMMGQNDTSFSCDGTDSTFRVMFKDPIEIQPCENYVASATLKVSH